MTSLRVLLAMAAKFDLETLQLHAMNAFVHADLDKKVYVQLPLAQIPKADSGSLWLATVSYALAAKPTKSNK